MGDVNEFLEIHYKGQSEDPTIFINMRSIYGAHITPSIIEIRYVVGDVFKQEIFIKQSDYSVDKNIEGWYVSDEEFLRLKTIFEGRIVFVQTINANWHESCLETMGEKK